MSLSENQLVELPESKIVVHSLQHKNEITNNLPLRLSKKITLSDKIQLADRLPLPKNSRVDADLVVLDEDEYVSNLEHIITRDYFPDIHAVEQDGELMNTITDTSKPSLPAPGAAVDASSLSLQHFLGHVTSDDNQSMQRILLKDAQEARLKHWWIREGVEMEAARVGAGGAKGWHCSNERNTLMFAPNTHDDDTRGTRANMLSYLKYDDSGHIPTESPSSSSSAAQDTLFSYPRLPHQSLPVPDGARAHVPATEEMKLLLGPGHDCNNDTCTNSGAGAGEHKRMLLGPSDAAPGLITAPVKDAGDAALLTLHQTPGSNDEQRPGIHYPHNEIPQLTHVRRNGQKPSRQQQDKDGFIVPAPRPPAKRTIIPENTHFPRDFRMPGEKPLNQYDFTSVPNPSLHSWSHGLNETNNSSPEHTLQNSVNQANPGLGLQPASAFELVESQTPMTGSPIMTWGHAAATPMHLEEEDVGPLVLDSPQTQHNTTQYRNTNTHVNHNTPSNSNMSSSYAHNPPAPAPSMVRTRPLPKPSISTTTARGFRLLAKSDADRGAELLFSQAKRQKTPGSQVVDGMMHVLSASRGSGSQTPSVWGMGSSTPRVMTPLPQKRRY